LAAYYETIGERSWIGLQEVIDDDGSVQFKWIDGTPFNFDSWGQFQPGKLLIKTQIFLINTS